MRIVIIVLIVVCCLVIVATIRKRKWAKREHQNYIDWLNNSNLDQDRLRKITNYNRGTKSEINLVQMLLKRGIPPQTIFHDLYLKRYNGNYSQIDLVVATKVGIIVFEVKDYSGWIFGNGNNSQWTQVLSYGRSKYRFYNPVKQNNRHIEELKKQINQNVPFYSVIVFFGNCEFRDISFIPKETYIVKSSRVLEVLNIIMEDGTPANYTNKHEVVRILNEAVHNGDCIATQVQHVNNIENMLGKNRVFD